MIMEVSESLRSTDFNYLTRTGPEDKRIGGGGEHDRKGANLVKTVDSAWRKKVRACVL
jgi:hypothetical protein